MQDWDKLNETKRKEILLGQAINIVADRHKDIKISEFKERVKLWYKILTEIQQEIIK